jgi:hypothetical protein
LTDVSGALPAKVQHPINPDFNSSRSLCLCKAGLVFFGVQRLRDRCMSVPQ